MQFLALDRGNSLMKATVLERIRGKSVQILSHTIIEAENLEKVVSEIAVRMIADSADKGDNAAGMYCGVGVDTDEYKRLRDVLSKAGLNLYKFDSSTPIPIINKYLTPATLGPDRMAALCGVVRLFPDTAAVVADAGTALTLDILSSRPGEKAAFEGGNISAGINLRLRALNAYTGRLPLVTRAELESSIGGCIGNDTHTALCRGALTGVASETLRVYRQAKEKYNVSSIIATGGDSALLCRELRKTAGEEGLTIKIIEEPDLLAIGLLTIYEYNHQK